MAEGALYYSFTVNFMIRGYHICKDIWESPTIGEELFCEREIGNPKDPLAVAVMKLIGGENTIIGHIPRIISALCSLFIRRGGILKCSVDGSERYSADLPQGGMDRGVGIYFDLVRPACKVNKDIFKYIVQVFEYCNCASFDSYYIVRITVIMHSMLMLGGLGVNPQEISEN